MPAPPEIINLIGRFDAGFNEYKHVKYGETSVRESFINKFFEALGWDVTDNENGREVTLEHSLDDQLTKIRPDYCFNAGGEGKTFFLEAKKPSVNLEKGHNPALQIRRYSWTANHSIGALTDFEELSVYYGRGIEPKSSDGPDVARLFYCNFREYADKWDEIHAMFSRQAVLDGSLERHAAAMKTKRGSQEVDTVFLNDIEAWRLLLAGHIASNNPELTQRELNALVQQTIDRIIFLRICEDRDIEPYGTLEKLLSSESVYQQLVRLFKSADSKYNSGLFYFKNDTKRSGSADTLALDLKIQDEPLKQIIQRLYFPHGPYAFSVMPADILGQVYERFLGKAIQVQPDRSVVVEEKPEVRKAGGVYYTPTYIVDYIVRSTVGKLVEGKAPDDISSMRVLDPACGSGSFLIRAYQYLLDWHLNWYLNNDPPKHIKCKPPKLYQDSNDRWHLAIHERKRILLNNIYGVDIDSQAVEVSKLSLLLKVLEGENSQSMTRQLSLFKERALPDLGDNIKCGNSLIGRDFYSGQQSLFSLDEKLRINAFDWETEFSDAMKTGGFDAVIGNPPYIRIQGMKEWAPIEVEFYKKLYKSASKGNYDIYVVFVERAMQLLNKQGRMGFILPHKFFKAQYGEPLRELVAGGKHLSEIVHFGDQQVFAGALTYTCMLFLDKAGNDRIRYTEAHDLDCWRKLGSVSEVEIPANNATVSEWNFVVGPGMALFERLSKMTVKLGDVADRIFQGLVTGADPVFIVIPQDRGVYRSDATKQEHSLEKKLLHPLCKGAVNIRRYEVRETTKHILFPYKLINGKAVLLSSQELADQYPFTWAYLQANRGLLESRERGKWKHDRWYAFGRSQNLSEMEQKKLLTPSIANQASFMLDADDFFYFVGSGGGGGGGYGVTLKKESSLAYEYILGLMNSKLLDTYLKSYSSPFSGGYYAYNRQYIEKLPIPTINFSDKKEVGHHDRMVAMVQKMIDLHKQLSSAREKQEIEELKRDIAFTDKEIDRLVYELYDLTDDEIAIVEKK